MKKKSIYIATAVLLLMAGVFFYQNFSARSASYSFFQTNWSGGASTADTAVHPGDSSGWDKYYSADSTIATDTPGQISLKATSSSWTQSSTEDFNLGTFSATHAVSDKIFLLKPDGVACTEVSECLNDMCVGGFCNDCGGSFSYAGKTYGTVEIGEQCWMAENLNVGTKVDSTDTGVSHSDVSDNDVIEKYCYGNNEANCTTYGGLYDWEEAMGYVTTSGAQGICPSGWHIPTDSEWHELENFLATGECDPSRTTYGCVPAGTLLKAGGGSGFQALMTGYRTNLGAFTSSGATYLITSSQSGLNYWRRGLDSNEGTHRGVSHPRHGLPLRCIKN